MRVECPSCHASFTVAPRRRQKQSNLAHKLIGAYAREQAIDFEYAKALMKWRHGPWVSFPFPGGEVPEWPGRFFELFEGTPDHCIVYMKSESAYTKGEETQLINGVMSDCMEAQIDLSWMRDE